MEHENEGGPSDPISICNKTGSSLGVFSEADFSLNTSGGAFTAILVTYTSAQMPDDASLPSAAADTLSDVVRRAILEAADMKDIEDRARQLGERTRFAAETSNDETGAAEM